MIMFFKINLDKISKMSNKKLLLFLLLIITMAFENQSYYTDAEIQRMAELWMQYEYEKQSKENEQQIAATIVSKKED